MDKEIAQLQVEAFIKVLYDQYGLSERDIHQFIDTVVRIQERTAFARRMGEWTAKSIIGVLVVAFFSGVGWTVIHFIQSLVNKG